MIPKKIYLSKEELQDIITCERMVSIDEPYEDLNEEYVNLKQVWHDESEEPEGDYHVLCIGVDDTQWLVSRNYIADAYSNWRNFAYISDLVTWAYISDLLPKGGKK